MKKTVSESDNKTGDIYNGRVVSDCCRAELCVEECGMSQLSFDLRVGCSECGKKVIW